MLEKLMPNHNVRIPLYFVMFFVTIAAVDAFFVYKALSTHNGVITENAYEKGLRHNKTIKMAESEVSKSQKISFQGLKNFKAKINYSINTDLEEVKVKIERPIEKNKNFEINLISNNSKNNYSGIVIFPEKGSWDLILTAKTKDAEYRKKERIFIK